MKEALKPSRNDTTEATGADQGEPIILYWVYEFWLPHEKRKELTETAARYGLSPEAYIEYGLRCILEHEELAQEIYEASIAAPQTSTGSKLLCHYPVHEHETEEEAFMNAIDHTTEQ